MKILRVIPSMNPKQGGPCQGIRNSIPTLNKLGHSNEVVCLDDSNASYLGQDDFIIHTLGQHSTPWQYHKALKPWLAKNLLNFDAVIIHGLWSYHAHATTKVIADLRKTGNKTPKVYVMPHGMLDPYFQQAKERRLKALRNDIYWKLIENNVCNSADAVLFTCEEELVLARTTFPKYHPKLEVNVGYGIQSPPVQTVKMTEAFKEKVPDWNGKPFWLFLSRIHEKKGVNLLIEAYLKMAKTNRNLPQLIIAGPGLDAPYGKSLIAQAADDKNIIFPGMLKGDAKWGAFYHCEFFVLTSHQENFGIAIVEALACKKPVLISNKINIWREIENGGGGFVEENNSQGAFELLQNWVKLSESQKEEMALMAEKTFLEKFTIEKAGLNLSNFLNSNAQ